MTDVKIIKDQINVKGIGTEIDNLIKKYPRLLSGQAQISLQSNDPNVTPVTGWNCSIGRLKNVNGKEADYVYPVFPELQLINHYMKSFNMTRSRIMINQPKECMTIHIDPSPRIHIPVYSNEKCLMIIDRIGYYLEPGCAYWTDTRKPHTAMNGSLDKRIHIIGCVTE